LWISLFVIGAFDPSTIHPGFSVIMVSTEKNALARLRSEGEKLQVLSMLLILLNVSTYDI